MDTSEPQSFTITVTAVNQAPSFTAGPNQTVLQDSGWHYAEYWATHISAGPPNESWQSVWFETNCDNYALFSTAPSLDPWGDLGYQPAAGASGTAAVSVRLHDNGGTTNGGVDVSAWQSFTITVLQPPTANNDSHTVEAGTTFTAGAGQSVLLNDVSPSGRPLTAIKTSEPANGTVTFHSDGTFSYTPTARYTGLDWFYYQASDGVSLSNTATVYLDVVDTIPPVITAPNMVVEATSPQGAMVSYNVSVVDNVTVNPSFSCIPASGSQFPIGLTTVYVTAWDNSMNYSCASFTVTVHDTTPPTFTFVPGNVTVGATSTAGAVVTYMAAYAWDATTPSPSMYYSQASGTLFPIGTTTVSITATDFYGNSATTSFTVTVTKLMATVTLVCPTTTYDGTPQSVTATTSPAGLTVDITYNGSSQAPTDVGTYTVVATINDPDYQGNGTGTLMITPSPIITTVAGNGVQDFAGDGGPPTSASLNSPVSAGFAVMLGTGDLYIADKANHCIRKVSAATDVISTVAGQGGSSGYYGDGDLATNATLSEPASVAVDSTGNIYIADTGNYRVRKVDATTGIISTAAGNGSWGSSGDDGPATAASFYGLSGLALDSTGSLYIADSFNNRVRKVDAATGIITTVAGDGTAGYRGDGAVATSARLSSPTGLAFDQAGNLYIADSGNNVVRRVDKVTQVITTIAGSGVPGFWGDDFTATNAALAWPTSIAVDDAGNVLIADSGNHRVREVDAFGTIRTVAGDGNPRFAGEGGLPLLCSLNTPSGVAFDVRGSGGLYIADRDNNRIRRVGTDCRPAAPSGLAVTHSSPSQTQLSWLANASSAQWYKVERKGVGEGDESFAEIGFAAQGAASYVDATVQPQTGYVYRVRATNFWGDSAYSNEASVINSPPVAQNLSLSTNENVPLTIANAATDVDGDNLTYTIIAPPFSGTLSSATLPLVYTPNPGFWGTDTFTFKANDGQADSNIGTVTIFVNYIPAVQDVAVTTNQNTPVQITLTGTDAQDYPLTFTVVDQPVNGNLAGTTPNLTYTPSADFHGSDSFTFQANNGIVDSNIGRVSITVALVSTTPIAVNDTYNVAMNAPTTVSSLDGVLANDMDASGAPLTAILGDGPTNGSLILNPDGSFAYTPDPGFQGIDSFTYEANNGALDSNVALANIHVTGQATPVFSNLTPDAWTNQAQPTISGDMAGIGINTKTLLIELRQVFGTTAVPIVAFAPGVDNNHFQASPPFSLEETTYEVAASISTNGNAAPVSATWRFQVDLTPPVLLTFSPNAPASEPRPMITASYSDALSGIATVGMTLDGESIADFTSTATDLSYVPAADLAVGMHTIVLTLTDQAGNQTVGTCFIQIVDPNVDVTPPVFGTVWPPAQALISCSLPTPAVLAAEYSDDQSGVDAGSVKLFLDGTQVTLPEGAATATGLQYPLAPDFPDGPHTWRVEVCDYAGNGPAVLQSTFVADSTPPTLVSMYPDPQTSLVDATPLTHINAVFTDGNGSGVDMSTLSVLVNDIDYSSLVATVGQTFSLQLPQPIASDRVIQVSVCDLVGNLLVVTSAQTPALSHFSVQSIPGDENSWVEVAPPIFSLIYSPNHVYSFRASYTDGLDPLSFRVVRPRSNLQGLTVLQPDTNGQHVYFQLDDTNDTGEPMTAPVAVSFTINDAAGQSYPFSGSIGLYSEQNNPAITVATPSGITADNPQATGTYGPFTPITFAASADSQIATITMTVNGAAVALSLDQPLPARSVNGTFQPAQPYNKGSNSFTVAVCDVFGCSTTLTGSFTVDYAAAPTISVSSPGGYVGTPLPLLTFTVDDGQGFGVAADQTTLSYTSNGVTTTVTPQIVSQTVETVNYSYQFQDNFADGAVITYIIQAQDKDPVVVHYAAPLAGCFTVDLQGPVINGFNPPAGTIGLATTSFSFNVADDLSGVSSFTAYLTEIGSQRTMACSSGISAGTQTLALPQGASLTSGVAYLLTVEATDNAGNQGSATTRYLAGEDTTGPTISIDPPDGGTVTSPKATVVIQDTGAGVDPNRVWVFFDGSPLAPTSSNIDETQSTLTLAFDFPPGTPNGGHRLAVNAADKNGNPAATVAQFTLARPLPPTPVPDFVAVGTDLATFHGRIPAQPGNLVGLSVSANGATFTSSFDLLTMEWQVVFAKGTADTFTYAISYVDDEGFVSPRPFAGMQRFKAGQAPPPAPPLPEAFSLPPGAIPPDSQTPLALYWDFAPEDITGVTRPNYSAGNNPSLLPYRGWVPASNTGTVRIRGKVMGAQPSCSVQAVGKDVHAETVVYGSTFEMTLNNVSEGLHENIDVVASDLQGNVARYRTRSLFVDKQPPLQVLYPALAQAPSTVWNVPQPRTAWKIWSATTLNLQLAYANPPPAGLAVGSWPAPFWGDEVPTSGQSSPPFTDSGIAGIELSFPDFQETVLAFPRDLDGLVYPGWPYWDSIHLPSDYPYDDNPPYAREWVVRLPVPAAPGVATAGRILPAQMPLTLKFTNGAGSQQTFSAQGCVLPGWDGTWRWLRAGTPYAFSGPGRTNGPLGDVTPDVGQIGILRWDSPGIFNQTLYCASSVTTAAPTDTVEVAVDDGSSPPDSTDPPADNTTTTMVPVPTVVRVYEPELKVDENNNGSTADEDQDRQLQYGALTWVNDGFELGNQQEDGHWMPDYESSGAGAAPGTAGPEDKSRQLVTFDAKLHQPMPASFTDYISDPTDPRLCATDHVTLSCSSNVQLWRTRGKAQFFNVQRADGSQPANLLVARGCSKTWDLTKSAKFTAGDLAALAGCVGDETIDEKIVQALAPLTNLGDSTDINQFTEQVYKALPDGFMGLGLTQLEGIRQQVIQTALSNSEYADFANLGGKIYLECLPVADPQALPANTGLPPLPSSVTTSARWIQLECEIYTIRVRLCAVGDKNEGLKSGGATASIGGPGSVELSSGALKCAWPLAQSGSRIIPDIFLYYNSRDSLPMELNPRTVDPYQVCCPYPAGAPDMLLGEVPRRFRHSLEMRLFRGDHSIVLVDGDGTRVKFNPAGGTSLPPGVTDEAGVTWASEARKGQFSTITTVKQTRFGMERSYYVLIRPAESRQYLFERETGKLYEIRDGNDNTATLEYEEYGGTHG
ncbi:MAG: Ig-like domain-containing protein, partial [Planctomycetota bacterium]